MLAFVSKSRPYESQHEVFQDRFEPESYFDFKLVLGTLFIDQLLSLGFDRFPLDVLKQPELSLLL